MLKYTKEKKYRGITWFNDTDLSIKLGKSRGYVYMCLKRGMTYEEIIDYVINGKIKQNKNTISLLPHNQELFDKIMGLINYGQHSIFYSEATGLGKSFIFMRLVHDLFKGKKVLYIVPKIAIWNNINEYKEFELIKDYVTMTTYADFNSIKDAHYNYDALFIDECHHLASDIQGANILKVCDDYINENKYVFGFTATPETSIPDINASDYFESKVYGMDIIEAIESGIFNKIEYVIADDDTVIDKEYSKKYSIDSTKTILKNILSERSDITRWLVYFSKIEDLNMNLPSIKRLFPDFKIFIMHSDNDDNDKQFKEFNSYDGKAMLISISMILEGVHPKNIGGIMLYRNVFSNNVLLQILGRICDINSTIQPLCIDITNSIYNASLSFISKSENRKNNIQTKRFKSILDMEASSYRYIELAEAILSKIKNIHEYRGITWTSGADLSRKLGMGPNYIYFCLKKGKTYEDIIDYVLDGKVKKIEGGEYRGITWASDTDLSIKLGMSKSYVCQCLNKGKTYKEIIDDVLDGKAKKIKNREGGEYRGIIWVNDSDLSRKLGRGGEYVHRSLKKGKTYKEIIDDVLDGKVKKIKKIEGGEYRGITWTSNTDLSRKLGMRAGYVRECLNRGKTHEKIIDYVLDNKLKKEYRNITWYSHKDLSIKLGMGDGYVYECLKKGKTYEDIIDYVLDGKVKKIEGGEYRGITWASDTDLSIKLGMSKSYVCQCLNKGKTYKEIIDDVLDGKAKKIKNREGGEYRGIIWASDTDLSRKLGMNNGYVHRSLKKGKTYKEIIDHVLDSKKYKR